MLSAFNEHLERAKQRQEHLKQVLALSSANNFLNAIAEKRFKLINEFFEHWQPDENEYYYYQEVVNAYPNILMGFVDSFCQRGLYANDNFLVTLQHVLTHLNPRLVSQSQYERLHQFIYHRLQIEKTTFHSLVEKINYKLNLLAVVSSLIEGVVNARKENEEQAIGDPVKLSPNNKESEEKGAHCTDLRQKAGELKAFWGQQKALLLSGYAQERDIKRSARFNLLANCYHRIKQVLGETYCEEQRQYRENVKRLKSMR